MAVAPKNGGADSKAIQVSGVLLTGADGIPEYYVNHVEVSHSIHEYEMIFGRIHGRLSEDQRKFIQEKRKFPAESLVRISLPPTLIDDLIKVLQIQKEKYAKTRASIREKSEPRSKK